MELPLEPVPETIALLLAHPVAHSLSPVMHNAALRVLGLVGQYKAVDTEPSALESTLEELCRSNLLGANLSIPHKETGLAWLTERNMLASPMAHAIGAVNTLVRQGNVLVGHNTDAPGFLKALDEAGCEPAGLETLMLGAGGAGRAVAWALARSGARVHIWNRTPKRAVELAQALSQQDLSLKVVPDEALAKTARNAELIVNCTSAGLNDVGNLQVLEEALPQHGWLIDLVYRPLETQLLRTGRLCGLRTIDGLGMLVHQGALALELWTKQPAPIDVMRAAVLKALSHS